MENAHLPDQVLHNIFVRLPGKSLVRFRCVSKHWDLLISDPYLAKSISRPKILLQFRHRYSIDHDNVPVQDMAQSAVRISSDFGNISIKDVTIVGTFHGIVLLVLKDTSLCSHMILYNPFTQAYNEVTDPPVTPQPSSYNDPTYNIGFAATKADFKIVRLMPISYYWYVFSVKKNSWSKPKFIRGTPAFQDTNVGVFLNGRLYWVTYGRNIWALDIKDMTLSNVKIPDECFLRTFRSNGWTKGLSRQWDYSHAILGGLHGCLCMIYTKDGAKFDLWVLKEQGVENLWSRASSFNFSFERRECDKLYCPFNCKFFPIRVLANGRILLTNSLNQVIIYDTSNDSDKTFNFVDAPYSTVYGIEYVQSLLSPSNMSSV